MSDKPKNIQEALAEVQRKVNEERIRRVEAMNREIIGDLDEESPRGLAFNALAKATRKASSYFPDATKAVTQGAEKLVHSADDAVSAVKNAVSGGSKAAPAAAPAAKAAAPAAAPAASAAAPAASAASGSASAASKPGLGMSAGISNLGKRAITGTGAGSGVSPAAPSLGSRVTSTASNVAKTAATAVKDNPKTAIGGVVAGAAAVTGASKIGGASTPAPTNRISPAPAPTNRISQRRPAASAPAAAPSQPKQTFAQAYAAARKTAASHGKADSGVFTYNGKSYGTVAKGKKGESYHSRGKLRNVDVKGPAMEEVDNPLIAAFLELQGNKDGNIFEASKKLSAKQKKIAALAGDKDEIDADDLKALRDGKKVDEGFLSNMFGGEKKKEEPKKDEKPNFIKQKFDSLNPFKRAADAIDGAMKKESYEVEVEYNTTTVPFDEVMQEGMLDPKDPSVQTGSDVTVSKAPAKKAAAPAKKKSMLDPKDGSVQGGGDVTYKEEYTVDEESTARKIEVLKSEGKHREAGELAAKSGHPRKYGAHYGMRSDKTDAEFEFHRGYDAVKTKKEKTNEDVELFSQEEIDFINSIMENE